MVQVIRLKLWLGWFMMFYVVLVCDYIWYLLTVFGIGIIYIYIAKCLIKSVVPSAPPMGQNNRFMKEDYMYFSVQMEVSHFNLTE